MNSTSSSSSKIQTIATIFVSYAHKDKALKERLEEHLSNLRYRGLINIWHDGEINAGDEWKDEIDMHLEDASVILLLISASFMASRYCYSIEMRQALERYERGAVKIIPILLRPSMFTDAPFARLQWLPSNGKSITTWRNRDSAFVDVAIGIERVLLQQQEQKLFPPSFPQPDVSSIGHLRLPVKGTHIADPSSPFLARLRAVSRRILTFLSVMLLRTSGQQRKREQVYYQQALNAYEEALTLNPTDMIALKGKGIALEALKDYTQALDTFHQWTVQAPHVFPYTHMGDIFMKLKQPHNALRAYEQAIICDPQYALAYYGLGQTLTRLGQTNAAEQAYRQAKQVGYENE